MKILGSSEILNLMAEKAITGAYSEDVAPASIDIRITDEIYLIDQILPLVQSKNNVGVQRTPISVIQAYREQGLVRELHDIRSPLEPSKVYLAKLQVRLENVPYTVLVSPKSSIGRLDLHVRVINPYLGLFDRLQRGYSGEVWAILISRSFRIRLSVEVPLLQLRFIDPGDKVPEDWVDWRVANVNFLRLGLNYHTAGWVALKTRRILKLGEVNPGEFFFRRIPGPLTRLPVEKNRFYIFATYEKVLVEESKAYELLPFEAYVGEFRSHYAGFVDPGWGVSTKGRELTLEVRPFESMLLSHLQPIARGRWYDVRGRGSESYDTRATSHYVMSRGPTLSRFLDV